MENKISLPQDSPCRIVKWKVKVGITIFQGKVLALYKADNSDTQYKLKATTVGLIKKILVKEGELVPPRGDVLVIESCQHAIVMKDMCAQCGVNLRETGGRTGERKMEASASVAMVHTIPELTVSKEESKSLGRQDEERLLKDRKLVLLVDLDQTLIHTTNDNVPVNLKDVFHFQLRHGSQMLWYHTRFRPGTENFLRDISKLYELHICTFGARHYAHTIARFLDPSGEFFSHRILSRDECFNLSTKTANLSSLFPCGDSMVCIIDDREDVWNFIPSLVHVKPYSFFEGTADINAPPGLEKGGKGDPEGGNGKTKRKSKIVRVPKKKDKPKDDEPKPGTSYQNKESNRNNKDKPKDDEPKQETSGKSKKTDKDGKGETSNAGGDNKIEKEIDSSEKEVIEKGQGDDKASEEPGSGGDIKPESSGSVSATNVKDSGDAFEDDFKLSDDDNDDEEDVEEEGGETGEKEEQENSDQNKDKSKDVIEENVVDNESDSKELNKDNEADSSDTKEGDGKMETKEGDGKNETTEVDGKNETTEGDGKTATKEGDGKAETKDGDGKTESKVDKKDNKGKQPAESEEENADDAEYEEMEEWEDGDDYLMYLKDILTRVHTSFFEVYDKVKNNAEKQKDKDLKKIIPNIRKSVLEGVNLVFSGVVPLNTVAERTRPYVIAKALGANVQSVFVSKTEAEKSGTAATTHVVAVRPGTQKVKQATENKAVYIVTPDWLWSCNDRWEKVDERLFLLPKDGTEAFCDSPKPRLRHKFAEEKKEEKEETTAEPEVKTPLSAMFSDDNVASMFKEVDEALSDDDSDDDKDDKDEKNSDDDDEDMDSDDSDNARDKELRNKVLGNTPPGDTSDEDTLDCHSPRGWKSRKRKRPASTDGSEEGLEALDDEDPDEAKLKLYIKARTSPHSVFQRGSESSSSSDNEMNGSGSEDEMAKELERQFLH